MQFPFPVFVLSSSHGCLISYLCMNDFLLLVYVCLYEWAFPFVIFLFLVVAFIFMLREVPPAFLLNLVWWYWILLAFAYLRSLWFLHQISMRALLDSFIGCRVLPSITWNISFYSLLTCRISAEKSSDNLMGIPLYVICYFPLVAFNIFSWCLIFVSLNNMCLGMILLGFILYRAPCASWTWMFPFPCSGSPDYTFFKYFLRPFLCLFFI